MLLRSLAAVYGAEPQFLLAARKIDPKGKAGSGDAEIFYREIGSGPDLVLLHPFPAHHEVWMQVAEALAAGRHELAVLP